MEAMWTRVIRTGQRLNEKSTTSIVLTILPILFHLIAVILIIDPINPERMSSRSDEIANFLSQARSNIYFTFMKPQYTEQHITLICLLGLSEIIFLFLACKAELSQREQTAMKLIRQIMSIFSLPILSILLCSFRYMHESRYLMVEIVSILIIFVSAATDYICEYLNFTVLYVGIGKKDQSFDELGPTTKLFLKLILTYVVLKTQILKSERIALSILISVIHLVMISKLLRKKIQKYNPLLETAHYFTCILVSVYNLLTVLEIFIPLVAENKWLVILSTFIWSSLAFKNVLGYYKGLLLIQSPQHIKNESEAIAYIRLLYNVYENRHEPSNSILLLGLIKNHSSSCTNVSCICKIKSKDVTSLIKDDFFLKFIQLNIIQVKTMFSTYSVDISCLAFEVEVMKRFPIFFYKADIFRKKNQHKKMTLYEKYGMYLIEKVALQQVQERSSDPESSNVESMMLLKSQKRIQQCYLKLQSIVTNFANFYKYNSRSHCGLGLLKKQLEQIYVFWIQIMDIFGQKRTEQQISPELIYLMIFFYQNVFNLSFKTKPIFNRLDAIFKRLESKEVNKSKFDVSLYSENGCVLQSTLESNVFGFINKVSNNAPQIFKYPSVQSMLNMDVHRLLPRCVREQHMSMIKKWLETGSFKNINKLLQSFCYNYDEMLMKVLMRSQIAVIQDRVSIFIGIIKVDAENYMIVNKNHEIDSYGLEFSKILTNQCRFKSIENIVPDWRNVTMDISRQPTTVKAKVISQGIVDIIKPKSRFQPESDQLLMGMQVYIKSMRFQNFIVVRKLHITKADQDNLLYQDNKMTHDIPESVLFRSSRMLTSGNGENMNVLDLGSTSSKANQANFSIWMMLQQITNRASAGKSLSYPLLKTITAALLLLVFLILATISCLFMLQIKGVDSFNQVIFADSAVSDNMQLLEIHYNNILMVGQHCIEVPNQEKCSMLQKTMKDAERILGDLLIKDIQYLIKNKTFLGHSYFQYQLTQVNLNIDGVIVPISTYQFMQYYMRETKIILDALSQNKPIPKYRQTVAHLQANWGEMKRINHHNLKFYEAVGITELNMCNRYAIMLSVLYGVLLSVEMLFKYYLYREDRNFLNSILTLFRRISTKISEELSQYFETLSGLLKIKDVKVLLKMQMPTGSELQNLSLRDYTQYTNTRKILYLWLFWSIFVVLTGISAYKISQYNELQKNSILTLNNLMKSENDMFESYFQMKSIYFYTNFTVEQAKVFYDKVLNQLGVVENQFVKTSLGIVELASTQNVQLAIEFSNIVIENVCQATKHLLNDRQYHICTNMNMGILDQGILVAMTFFQNAIFAAAFKMKQGKQKHPDLFNGKQYEDLDLYFVYLLRIYQITQSKMIDILNQIMEAKLGTVIILVIAQISLQIGSFIYWCITIDKKKWRLAQSYGFLLVLPFSLIKESKFMQQQLRRLL